MRPTTELLAVVAERFRYVQIEHQDFAAIIQTYQSSRTLFYVDPPYIGCEDYYDAADRRALFTEDDHQRLAVLLSATPAYVVLSYYEHPQLSDLYPAARWRRLAWTQAKAVQKTRESRKLGCESLPMNYPEMLGLSNGLA